MTENSSPSQSASTNLECIPTSMVRTWSLEGVVVCEDKECTVWVGRYPCRGGVPSGPSKRCVFRRCGSRSGPSRVNRARSRSRSVDDLRGQITGSEDEGAHPTRPLTHCPHGQTALWSITGRGTCAVAWMVVNKECLQHCWTLSRKICSTATEAQFEVFLTTTSGCWTFWIVAASLNTELSS